LTNEDVISKTFFPKRDEKAIIIGEEAKSFKRILSKN